jgi:hydrogenase maturation protein HypF
MDGSDLTTLSPGPALVRWRVRVRGIVQGVGFRPFVYGLALRLQLVGWVRNDADGVIIEAEGTFASLVALVDALRSEAPPLARVDAVMHEATAPRGDPAFAIVQSADGAQRNTLIAPDSATCPDCVRELFDPTDRRYRYPFINCTNCGPRFTIVADVPYDRPNTTMQPFALCARCQREYDDPLDRRFHAQPNACPDCGPQLAFEKTRQQGDADQVSGEAALAAAVHALLSGQIVAIKGLGGYHLACDAHNAEAVQALRARKQREAKPFALMVPDLASARMLCLISPAEEALLTGHRRPIVLLARRTEAALAPAVAPGRAELGVMLPYTPLHHLLLHDWRRARGGAQPLALVLTSGNRSDEPIAYADDEACARLGSIADAVLLHNRAILTRCDDTVTRVVAAHEHVLRRGRGYAPEPLTLAAPAPLPLLACGAHLKNTFCLARDQMAVVSHHIGDLENLETLQSFREGIAHLGRLFDITPEAVAYDLHPEYLATKEALALPLAHKIGVQHHHAHIASVLAEHRLFGPVIGIAADGTGYGLDGAIWGGEVFVADLRGFERAGHLAYVALPGGEAAVREPWRMAASYLYQCYGSALLELDIPFVHALDAGRWRLLQHMIARGVNSPPTSSMGRLFDAVAALIGLRGEAHYEGQAAIELETLAARDADAYPFGFVGEQPFRIDMQPTIRAIVADIQAGAAPALIAGRFHAAVAAALCAACQRVRAATGLCDVALSGGVWQNRVLLERLTVLLASDNFVVYTNQRVPPNDGGISLGQIAVAAAILAR